MLKSVQLTTALARRCRQLTCSRSFLSESYKCTEVWNERLSTPILQNVGSDNFYYELESKFQQEGKASAIDIDLFVNTVQDGNRLDEVADICHKLRLTEETTNTLDSTSHAVIRAFLQHSQIDDLLDILNNRISYGIFLDHFTANLALDKLIKSKDFTSAARIASFLALQEDLEHPISRSLSLYASLKYLTNPEPFEKVEEVVEAAPVEQVKIQKSGKTKKVEEVRVRVKFLRNPYFDDHFDLTDGRQLVGKTLTTIARTLDSGTLQNSIALLGHCFYQKYDVGQKLLKSIGDNVHKDAVKLCLDHLTQITGKEEDAIFQQFLENIQKLQGKPESLDEAVCTFVNKAIAENESKDIAAQKKTYAEWCDLRVEKLNAELERLKRAQRLRTVEQLSADLEKEEQKLWFFENEDQLDLKIDSKKVYYRKKWFGKRKVPRAIDAGYIVPEMPTNR